MTENTEQTENQTPPNWNDVLELAGNCDGVIRQSSMALMAIHARGAAEPDVVSRITKQMQDYKARLEETLKQVPGRDREVTEDEHPVYLKAFIEVADIKDLLFDELLPELGEITESVTGSNPMDTFKEKTSEEESTNESA